VSTTFVGNPAVHRVEVSGVIATSVQCKDGNEMNRRLRDVKDVCEFQFVAAGDVEHNVTNTYGIDSQSSQALHGMMWDVVEHLEIGGFGGDMASHPGVQDEWEFSSMCDLTAASRVGKGGLTRAFGGLGACAPVD